MWTERSLLQRIKDQLEQIQRKYQNFIISRDWIVTLFRTDLGINFDREGKFFGEGIYEGTAPWASRTMAKGLQGNMVSRGVDWLMYRMQQEELNGVDELDIWCQDIKDHMTQVYKQSNFYDVQPGFIHDGVTIGSPLMFGEEDVATSSIMWLPQHYINCFIFYNRFNKVEGVIIEDKHWTAKQIFDTFITEKTPEARKAARKEKLSNTLNKAIDEGNMLDEFTILRAVFKRDDPIWDGGEQYKFKKPIGGQTWIDVYFESDTEKDKDNEPLKKSGHFSQPFVVMDYDKKLWEACSRTPAYDAIWDTASSNDTFKAFLENLKLKNRPPIMHLDTMAGRLQLGAEGLIPVNKQEYQTPPKALFETIGDITMTKEGSDILAANIKRHFQLEFFTRFNDLANTNKQPVSVQQILKMAAENATLLNPAIDALTRYLAVADERMLGIEMQARRGPFDLATMANIQDVVASNIKSRTGKFGVIPEFVGLLARAQKMQQQLEPIMTGVDIVTSIAAKLNPNLVNTLKGYEVIDTALNAINFPKNIINTEDDYDEIEAAINRAKAQTAQTQTAIEMMKASKNIQGPVDPNSVLAGAGQAMAGAA